MADERQVYQMNFKPLEDWRMKLFKTIRSQSIFTIWSMMSIAVILTAIFVVLFSSRSLKNLEQKNGEIQMTRVQSAIDFSLDAMSKNVKDWGIWDDTYNYLTGTNPTYEDDNLYLEAFEILNIDMVIIFDDNRDVFFSKSYDFTSESESAVTQDIINDSAIQSIVENSDGDVFTEGLLSTSQGLYLIVSTPIMLSDLSSDPSGNMIFGRLLNEAEVAYLSGVINLEFSITTNSNDLELNQVYVKEIDQQEANVAKVANDLSSKHDYIFSLDMPRDYITIYRANIFTLVIALVAFNWIFSLLLLFFLDKNMFKRLSKLNSQIQDLSKQNVFSERIPDIVKADEIGNISKEINTMLDKLYEAHKEINKLAYIDYLTKLPNRLHFYDLLEKSISEATNKNEQLAVLYIDLDYFKNVNDQYGHLIGDKLLVNVTSRIVALLTENDTFARTGGDEFLILLRKTNKENAKSLCHDIIESFKDPIVIDTLELNVTASIGIAMFTTDKINRDDLIMRADIAMYKAKALGKNQFCFWDENIRVQN
jgi:diguanylate cyclase (GGDEF)-like protein